MPVAPQAALPGLVAQPVPSGTARERGLRPVVCRRDLAIAACIALLLHLWFFFGEQLAGSKSQQTPTPARPTVAAIEIASLPSMDTPADEPSGSEQGAAGPVDYMPPSSSAPALHVAIDTSQFAVASAPLTGIETTNTIVRSADFGAGLPLGGHAIFECSEVDQLPVVLSRRLPQYPPFLERTGITGTVVISFIVDGKGWVAEPRVSSSTRSEFEEAALQAVSRWRFKPGRKAGRPVCTRMEAPITFTLAGRR